MEEYQKDIVTKNMDNLKKMNYYLIIEKLKEKNVITEDEYKKYEDTTPNIKKLLDDIKNKPSSFEKLKESLEEIGQGYLLPDQIESKSAECTFTYTEKLYQLKKNETRTDETVKKIDVTVQSASRFLTGDASDEIRQYSTRSKNRGVILIINNNNISNQKERKGSEEDVRNLCALFEQLNFKKFVHRDLTENDMRDKINIFKSKKETKIADICVVIVLSHGGYLRDEGNSYILSSDNKEVKTSWICEEFNNKNCPVLLNKPKIILFNACRSRPRSTVTDVDKQTSIYTLEVSDMLIGYSTTLGYVSYRNEEYGSWYILAICEAFAKYAHKYDIGVLLSIVTQFVINMSEDGMVPTPAFINHAFGYCYLHPNIYEENKKMITFN